MKNKILFFLLYFSFVGCISAQQVSYPIQNNKSIITIKSLYKGYGKVFDNTFDGKKYIKVYGTPLTLTEDLIIEAEQILFEDYKPVQTKKNAQQYFHFYYRQYVGFKDDNGDSIVLINLLNFRNPKEGEKLFFSWQSDYVKGFGEPYENNQKTILINLSKKKIMPY